MSVASRLLLDLRLPQIEKNGRKIDRTTNIRCLTHLRLPQLEKSRVPCRKASRHLGRSTDEHCRFRRARVDFFGASFLEVMAPKNSTRVLPGISVKL